MNIKGNPEKRTFLLLLSVRSSVSQWHCAVARQRHCATTTTTTTTTATSRNCWTPNCPMEPVHQKTRQDKGSSIDKVMRCLCVCWLFCVTVCACVREEESDHCTDDGATKPNLVMCGQHRCPRHARCLWSEGWWLLREKKLVLLFWKKDEGLKRPRSHERRRQAVFYALSLLSCIVPRLSVERLMFQSRQ